MSFQNGEDYALDLNDFPDEEFVQAYTSRCKQYMGGGYEEGGGRAPLRGDERGRAAANGNGRPNLNPEMNGHDTEAVFDKMSMDKLTIDISVLMSYDQQRKAFYSEIKAGDMQDFMSASTGKGAEHDMSKAFISELEVLGFDGVTDRRWALSINDGSSGRMQKSLIKRSSGVHAGGKFNLSGVPLLSMGGNNGRDVLYHNDDEKALKDIEKYGNLTMDMLTEGCFPFMDKRNPHVLVPLFPNGLYFYYALSQASNLVGNLKLDSESEYLKLETPLYDKVISAYERKQASNDSHMHNLTGLTIQLRPLSSKMRIDVDDEFMICFRITCYMPKIIAR